MSTSLSIQPSLPQRRGRAAARRGCPYNRRMVGPDDARVLRAALRVFRDEGFHASRPVSFAEATGVDWDGLLLRFGDKEALFYAALDFACLDGMDEAHLAPLLDMARKIDRMAPLPRMRLVHKRVRAGIANLTARPESG